MSGLCKVEMSASRGGWWRTKSGALHEPEGTRPATRDSSPLKKGVFRDRTAIGKDLRRGRKG